jgi:hypothetical protein
MKPSTQSALGSVRPANFAERCCQACTYLASVL